jgi:SH3-like domain-containing protein
MRFHSLGLNWGQSLVRGGWMMILSGIFSVVTSEFPFVQKGAKSGAKHSLYAVLRAKVNLRCGPGPDHDVSWCYESPGWPVIILKKYDNWYYIQDSLGTRGWVKGPMLSFKTNLLVVRETMLYAKPDEKSRKKAKLLKGALVRYIKNYESRWVHVAIPEKGIQGWVASHAIWPNPCQNLTFNIEPTCAPIAHPVRNLPRK